MIGVVIECRLGNQLFQYAFALELSKRHHVNFVIYNSGEFFAPRYFELKEYSTLKNILYRAFFKISTFSFFKKIASTPIHDFQGHQLEGTVNNKVYQGYFQSDQFFPNIKKDLKSHFKIKSKFKEKFELQYEDFFSTYKVIAVHIRRGDYLNLNTWWKENLGSSDLSLPKAYYLKCLSEIEDLHTYKILFVSDDYEFIRKEFEDIPNAVFSNNEMIIDFQIIMHAQVCILSNSSFSWWAAYLNPNEDKKIYCPKYWLGFKVKREYPRMIIPEGWNQIEVPEKTHS